MGIMDRKQIMKYLQYIEKNGEPVTEEEMRKYNQILEEILKRPSLQSFLDKRFGELIINYIKDNENIIEESGKRLKRNDSGFVILDGEKFVEREHNGPGIYAVKWVMVNNTPALIKELDKDNDIKTTLISEQIAREAGYEVAEYYPAIFEGKEVILTPSFLKIKSTPNEKEYSEEEIIQGKKISGSNMDISENPELIRKYFSEMGCSEEKIQELIEKYKSVMLYNIFINLRDGHNGNWGVIQGENNEFRFTPIFDLEGGLAENKLNIRPMYIHENYDDESMLKYLLEDKRIREYAKGLLKVDMDKVYEEVEKSKKIKIPRETRLVNSKVINRSKEKLEEILAMKENENVR